MTQSAYIRHFLTSEPCPYLPGSGKTQTVAIRAIDAARAPEMAENAITRGYIRNGRCVFTHRCKRCTACTTARIPVAEFEFTRGWRKVLAKNQDLTVHDCIDMLTLEQYTLFRRYITQRHHGSAMANYTKDEIESFVDTSPVETSLFEFHKDGKLLAVSLTDIQSDSLSGIYKWYDPEMQQRSLGSFVILWLIQEAQRRGLDYLYLGVWNPKSPKLIYKTRYHPVEVFEAGRWKRWGE